MVAKIRKGDKVIVIAGKDKGKQGEVLNVITEKNRVVIGGVNVVKGTRNHHRTRKVG